MIELFRPYPVLRRVIVNMKSGTAFSGVVWQCRGEWLVLRQAKILSDRGTKADQRVDGEVLVARKDIDFIQVAS